MVTIALVFVLLPTPTEGAFDRARGGMEELNAMQHNLTPHTGRSTVIDGLEFHVYIREDNCVYFADLEQSVVLNAGWIYTANCSLNPDQLRRYKPVADNWYAFP